MKLIYKLVKTWFDTQRLDKKNSGTPQLRKD